jgi:hypothetical protein
LLAAGRADSRERCGGSTAGRIPELLESPLGYAEMTGSSGLAEAPKAESAADDSPEVFAPPSGLPKILVRSPNVEFLALRSRDRLARPVRAVTKPSDALG